MVSCADTKQHHKMEPRMKHDDIGKPKHPNKIDAAGVPVNDMPGWSIDIDKLGEVLKEKGILDPDTETNVPAILQEKPPAGS